MHLVDFFEVPCFRAAFREVHAQLHAVCKHFSSADGWEGVGFMPVDNLSELKTSIFNNSVEERHKIVAAPHIAAGAIFAHSVKLANHLVHKVKIIFFRPESIEFEFGDYILVILQSGEVAGAVLIIRRVGENQIDHTIGHGAQTCQAILFVYYVYVHRFFYKGRKFHLPALQTQCAAYSVDC